jgi:hypothetical protein
MNPILFEEVVHQALHNHNAVRARVRSLACE